MANEISAPTHIPKAYLSKILQALSRHLMVSSARGSGGGFYLTKEIRSLPLMEIIPNYSGENRLPSCMYSLQECNAEHPYPMHDLVGDLKISFTKNLEETTVDDLDADIGTRQSFLPI